MARKQLTADVVAGASVWMTVSASKVELKVVALVGDKVGISIGGLPLGKLYHSVSIYSLGKQLAELTVWPSTSASGLPATRMAAVTMEIARRVKSIIA
jgi:hypothetical protein